MSTEDEKFPKHSRAAHFKLVPIRLASMNVLDVSIFAAEHVWFSGASSRQQETLVHCCLCKSSCRQTCHQPSRFSLKLSLLSFVPMWLLLDLSFSKYPDSLQEICPMNILSFPNISTLILLFRLLALSHKHFWELTAKVEFWPVPDGIKWNRSN